MTIDISSWAHQNLWLSPAGELVVRDAIKEDITAATIASTSEIVAGFSVKSPNTTEVQHYVFTRHTTTGVGTLRILDEEYQSLQTLSVGVIPPRPVVTHATISSPHVSSLELIIGGPDIPTIYGFVGSGVIIAEKVEDEDPNTTAIEVPRGIVAGFAGRAVIANGKNLYFSNPYGVTIEVSGEATFAGPRTYVGLNIGDMASAIYGLHTSEQGALIIATDTGLWGLPPHAVAQGLAVRDLFEKVSTHRTTGYNKTALSRSTVWGLSEAGVRQASSPSLDEIALDEPRWPRQLSEVIEGGDYRRLSLWSWERGIAVSQKHAVCLVDDVRGFRSWQVAPPTATPKVRYDVEIVGVLTERDGRSLFCSRDRIWTFYGGDELGGGTLTGVAIGRVPVKPSGTVSKEIVTTSSDTPGNQKCSVRGSAARSKDTPQKAPVIGTATWDSLAAAYGERAVRSRRHKFYERTDDVTVEVAAEHAGSRLGLVEVETGGQGRRRP